MLGFLTKISLLVFFLISSANADILKKIEINGNKRVSEQTIKLYGDIETKKDYQDKDLNDIVNKLYSTDFFEDVQLELSNNILKINLKEYPIINQLVIIGEKSKMLSENLEVTINFYNENPLSVTLPNQITCEIDTTDAAIKGQTVSSSYKPAKLTNGINIQVPPFIESGDKIILDTRTMEYIKKI